MCTPIVIDHKLRAVTLKAVGSKTQRELVDLSRRRCSI